MFGPAVIEVLPPDDGSSSEVEDHLIIEAVSDQLEPRIGIHLDEKEQADGEGKSEESESWNQQPAKAGGPGRIHAHQRMMIQT
jgi:hypothetical protein